MEACVGESVANQVEYSWGNGWDEMCLKYEGLLYIFWESVIFIISKQEIKPVQLSRLIFIHCKKVAGNYKQKKIKI